MRWAEILNRFSFTIHYRCGMENGAADSLSRREQVVPLNCEDKRLKQRQTRLLSPALFENDNEAPVGAEDKTPSDLFVTDTDRVTATNNPAEPFPVSNFGSNNGDYFDTERQEAATADEQYGEIIASLRHGDARFPTHLGLKLSMSHCELIQGQVYYKNRRRVPNHEPLRTQLI